MVGSKIDFHICFINLCSYKKYKHVVIGEIYGWIPRRRPKYLEFLQQSKIINQSS